MAVHLLHQTKSKPTPTSPSNHGSKKPIMTRSTNLILLLLLITFSLASLIFLYATTTTSHSQTTSAATTTTVTCDLSAFRTDVCVITGDVRLHPATASIIIPSPAPPTTIRPYPRKWEAPIMSTIHPLRMGPAPTPIPCDARHNATAVVFSTGGYTGNVFHDFNEGIIPLYLTTRPLNRSAVVLVVLDFKPWWASKYEIVRPGPTTEMARIYMALNSTDVMVGVHGAAMTHFLFMRPGTVVVQIVPLGTDWAARTYYGEPAARAGLRYVGYRISPEESSLSDKYERDDPVLRDPRGVNARGWEATKRVYLDEQNVRLDLVRFRRRLERAYWYLASRRRSKFVE